MAQPVPSRRASRLKLLMRHRHSIERKLLLWTLVMVVVPTLAGGLWLSHVTRDLLRKQQADTAMLVSQTLASALSDRITRAHVRSGALRAQLWPTLEALQREGRLAFVVITDARMTPVYRHAVDPHAWQLVAHTIGEVSPGAMHVDQPLFLPNHQGLVVMKVPVWHRQASARSGNPKLQGFVLLAMHDDTMAQALSQLTSSQVMIVCVMALVCLPVVILAVRKWCAPLRALLHATNQLAAGQSPALVPVHSRDELGRLAIAFNHMSRKLFIARKALEKANEALEQKVANRTSELEKLNRKLESEIHDKNEFIRAISHDLGAPLRNINGMTSVLLMKYRSEFSDDALAKLQRISANAKVQADLINDLLELSRIRARPARREQVDLGELMAQLAENLAFDLEKADIRLITQPQLPVIVAERTRMRQVLQNLLENAIKYMLDARTREIHVGCKKLEHHWHLTVRDTGCGISARDLPHIFDLFKRATHSNSHQVGGKGVGLSTVKTIIEHYGGRIWAQSTLGQGTTFHITLDRKTTVSRSRTPPSFDETTATENTPLRP